MDQPDIDMVLNLEHLYISAIHLYLYRYLYNF